MFPFLPRRAPLVRSCNLPIAYTPIDRTKHEREHFIRKIPQKRRYKADSSACRTRRRIYRQPRIITIASVVVLISVTHRSVVSQEIGKFRPTSRMGNNILYPLVQQMIFGTRTILHLQMNILHAEQTQRNFECGSFIAVREYMSCGEMLSQIADLFEDVAISFLRGLSVNTHENGNENRLNRFQYFLDFLFRKRFSQVQSRSLYDSGVGVKTVCANDSMSISSLKTIGATSAFSPLSPALMCSPAFAGH